MAIARYGSGGDLGDTSNSNTVSLDVGSGDNRFLVVYATTVNPAASDTTSVTYNGTSMTEVATDSPIDLQSNVTISCWYLANPASGTNNIVATRSGGTGTEYQVYGIAYSGVDSGSPDDTYGALDTDNTPATATVTTTTSNSWVVCGVTYTDTYSSWSGSAVEVGSLVFNGQSRYADTNTTVAVGSVNMTFNWTGTGSGNKAAIIAMTLEPAAAATSHKLLTSLNVG